MIESGDYISREALLSATEGYDWKEGLKTVLKRIPAADVRPVPEGGIGEMSDGYHTFNGLYYQRMVLFAALVNAYNGKAWKSWKHEDGKPCFDGGWFIVGIDTPQGSYTYHYQDKYWNWFECEELPVAKHWDGHTEKDVTRLMSLDMPRWIPVTDKEHIPNTDTGVVGYFGGGAFNQLRWYDFVTTLSDGMIVGESTERDVINEHCIAVYKLPEPPKEE